MRIRVPAPVCVPVKTVTPAAFETRRSAIWLTACVSTRSTAFTCAIALPTSMRRCCPVAVVTIGFSFIATDASEKSTSTVWPAATVTVLLWPAKPMRTTRTVTWPGTTELIWYRPSPSVTAPAVEPTMPTCVCWMGRSFPSSVTRPRMVPRCACSEAAARTISAVERKTRRTIMGLPRGGGIARSVSRITDGHVSGDKLGATAGLASRKATDGSVRSSNGLARS